MLKSGSHQALKTPNQVKNHVSQTSEPLKETAVIFRELLGGLSSLKRELRKLKNSVPPAVAIVLALPLQLMIHLITTCKDLILSALRQARCFFGSAGKTIEELLTPIGHLFQNLFREIVSMCQSLCSQIAKALQSTMETIIDFSEPIAVALANILQPFFDLMHSGCFQVYRAFNTFVDQLCQFLQPVGRLLSSLGSTAFALLSSVIRATSQFVHQLYATTTAFSLPIIACIGNVCHLAYIGLSSLTCQTIRTSKTVYHNGRNLALLLLPIFREIFSAFKILGRSGARSTAQFGKQCVTAVSTTLTLPLNILEEGEQEISILTKAGYKRTLKSFHTIKNTSNAFIIVPIEYSLRATYPLAREGVMSATHQAVKLHELLSEGFSTNLQEDVERSVKKKMAKLQKKE